MGYPRDVTVGTPINALTHAWDTSVSARTGRPDVSILRLGEVASLINNDLHQCGSTYDCLNSSDHEMASLIGNIFFSVVAPTIV